MSANPDAEDYLGRLQRFYQHYAPFRVSGASLTLEAYAGREDAMFRALERKYGPESAVPVHPTTTPRTDNNNENHISRRNGGAAGTIGDEANEEESEDDGEGVMDIVTSPLHFDTTRNRLERIYAHYAPELLGSVDLTLAAYEGRESVLFRVLSAKYGPEPKAFTPVPPHPASASPEVSVDVRDLSPHAKYDAAAALLEVGFPRDEVRATLAMYGAGRESYAAALALLSTLLGDALVDPDAARPVIFPHHQLRRVTGAAPGALEHIAFEHLLAYRRVFLAAAEGRERLLARESEARRGLRRVLDEAVGAAAYRGAVLREAVRSLPRAETERRARISRDEAEQRAAVAEAAREGRHAVVSNTRQRRRRPAAEERERTERERRRVLDGRWTGRPTPPPWVGPGKLAAHTREEPTHRRTKGQVTRKHVAKPLGMERSKMQENTKREEQREKKRQRVSFSCEVYRRSHSLSGGFETRARSVVPRGTFSTLVRLI